MAVSVGGFYGQTLLDGLDATASARDLTDNTNNTLSLINNSATPNFDDSTPVYKTGSTEFDNEASGVTAAALAGQTADITSVPGTLTWDANDWAQGSSTIVSAVASIIHDGTSDADALIILNYFGGTAYSTTNGTFTVAWHANGIGTIDYTP